MHCYPPIAGVGEFWPSLAGLTEHVVSYTDFVVVGYFQFAKRCGQDIFDRLMSLDPAFQELYHACAPWLARDDH